MENVRSVDREEKKIMIICILLGSIIGLFPLWNSSLLLIIVGGGFVLTFTIMLKTSYPTIVFLNVVLLSVVMVEPSPAELTFFPLLFIGLISGELDIEKIQQKAGVFVVLSGYILVNLLGLPNMISPLWGIKYFFITFYLILLSLFFFLYGSGKRIISILRAYVISTIISAAFGFIGYMGYLSSLLMYDEYRIKALFKDPNVFGPFLIPGIIILMGDFKSRKILGHHKILYILSMGLLSLGTIYSFSRAAWINLAVALLAFFLLNMKRFSVKKIILLFLILFLCLYFMWTYALDDHMRDFFTSRSSMQHYDAERFAVQRAGLSMTWDKVFGYGPGQYEVAVLKKNGIKFSAHNLYVRVMLENGIIGFVFFIAALLYTIVKLFLKHIKSNKTTITKSSVMLSILLGIMVNSLVIDTLHWRHLWLFLGLGLSLIHSEDRLSSSEGGL